MYGVVFISLTSNIKYVCAKGEGLQVSGAGCRQKGRRKREGGAAKVLRVQVDVDIGSQMNNL